MWIAENWKDYEVIDCSKGEKLERWENIFWSPGSPGDLGHAKNRKRLA